MYGLQSQYERRVHIFQTKNIPAEIALPAGIFSSIHTVIRPRVPLRNLREVPFHGRQPRGQVLLRMRGELLLQDERGNRY